ncbi:hypothetical protein Moror_6688 [Moniliophthora roreri MCA 2997]|uniref:Uncharacterized protein n=2 Tax=Moniliophthora roreri TaxID=221103 RepID=V2XC47_MONRO|nr:hypothetical protein Moror_6688 [Moniliophthora roreri MCA 2997]KAI3612630.1 hypothetical protein WG66_014680 [Moniliophthora roreri]
MPGPSNRTSRRNQRKSQARRAKPGGTPAASRIVDALKDLSEDASEQSGEDDRRQSFGSDSSLGSPELRTPASPRAEGQVVVAGVKEILLGQDYVRGDQDGNDFIVIPVHGANASKEIPACAEDPLSSDIPSSHLPTPHYSDVEDEEDRIILEEPCIHDPGNGPRVRNIRAFLKWRYFAQAPALDDPLRAEFAQEEVLQMLKTVLPEEMAMILWYNKSRATSRICPACHRLFHVGDVLPDAMESKTSVNKEQSKYMSPQLRREQDLSGLCSSMCFILAALNQCDPLAMKAAWGSTAEEIDEESWNKISEISRDSSSSAASNLLMVLRMTRLPDLGLAQLCFPDVDWESTEQA